MINDPSVPAITVAQDYLSLDVALTRVNVDPRNDDTSRVPGTID